MPTAEKYQLSFTTGGLFVAESVMVAEIFLGKQDWKLTERTLLDDNAFQSRTASSATRICREVCSRLKTLDANELSILLSGSPKEQRQILWIAVCRRYALIRDFAVHVLRERHLSLQKTIQLKDFDAFVHRLAETHEEFQSIAESTYKKLRQVLFRMLKEAELVDGNTISPVLLTPRIAHVIRTGNPEEIAIFPVFESDVPGWR
jgi:hypothetical protein